MLVSGVWQSDLVIYILPMGGFPGDSVVKNSLANIYFPGGLCSGKEPACQWRKRKGHGFDP